MASAPSRSVALLIAAQFLLGSLALDVDTILAAMTLVTKTFRTNNPPGDCHWERATYFFGHSAAMTSTGAADVNYSAAWATGNHFACNGSFSPNDFGCGWGYSALNDVEPGKPDALALGATMSSALASHALPPYSWWWVDTLSMNLPQWVYYGAALNRPEFIAFAQSQYNDTKSGTGAPSQPGLWSEAHGLWFRDHTFVGSSPPVFWSRGNAWAAAMIVRTLSESKLPAWHPLTQDLWTTLVAMAGALVPLQGPDGFWRSNLLNASAFPEPETSGTAGILALLAFGVRTGALPAAATLPAIRLGWSALVNMSLLPDGSIGYCQPVGDQPGPSSRANTSDFCTGLWLLAAAEVLALARSPPSSLPPFNLRSFETDLLPQWVAQFALADPPGGFAFSDGDSKPHAYGSAGVIHALSVVRQLPSDPQQLVDMAAVANSFENASTGFYELSGPEEGMGYQPWHSGGWVLSALRLLNASASYPPANAQTLAHSGLSAWEATFLPLLNGSLGINVWSASHKIAALPVQLMLSDADWAADYAPFFDWFWPFINATSSPLYGYWGTGPLNPPPPSNIRLGGAFHIAFTLKCGGQPLPNADALLNTTLWLQDPESGLWSGNSSVPTYMDQDGVYVAARSSVQLSRARWVDVRRACTAFVRTAARQLTSPSAILGPKSPFGSVSHNLAGLVTPVAECARWFPDLVVTQVQWVDTVDVGCFG